MAKFLFITCEPDLEVCVDRKSIVGGVLRAWPQPRRDKRVCAVTEHGLRNAENEEVEGVFPPTVCGGKEPAIS